MPARICTHAQAPTLTRAHAVSWRRGPDGQGGERCPVSEREREKWKEREREKREREIGSE